MQNTVNEAGNEGGSVTVALPDWAETRRELLATRKRHGADTPIGHRCSNILEQLENYQKCPAGLDRLTLRNMLGRSMAELASLVSKGERI